VSRARFAVVALTTMLSALLLFLVQPIIAKLLLPRFGGASAVWLVCLMFFQVVLLAGYAYAHWLTERLSARQQRLAHAALLTASLAALPILPSPTAGAGGATAPVAALLALLLATVGLPYFVLASTAPLLQRWIAAHVPARRVYRLYALSNLGSLVGLVAFPFAVEPLLTSSQQANAWSVLYSLFVACVLWLAIQPGGVAVSAPSPTAVRIPAAANAAAGRPGPTTFAGWMALSALGSATLLATSAHLTQNIAAVPFLWVLPLGLYLTSFVLVFEGRGGRGFYERRWGVPAMALAALLMAFGVGAADRALHITLALPLYCAGLLAVCLFCHGELALRRPPPRYFTHFYLALAAGGAAGGMTVALIAPLAYRATFELPVLLALIALAGAAATWRAPRQRAVALVAMAGTTFFGVAYALGTTSGSVHMSRSFYGPLRVQQAMTGDVAVRRLVHGVIAHGEQAIDPARAREPRAYFTATSGAGRAIRATQGAAPVSVGIIGLGVGTLAAYARAGDTFRFYELDPNVLDVARSEFTYLATSRGEISHVLGDARLSLERELAGSASPRYDVLVLDAFASDAIPVHLLTREALQLYLRMLQPDGTLAFHVSNRFLDLSAVVAVLAAHEGLSAKLVVDRPPQGSAASPSVWVLLRRTAALWPAALAHLPDAVASPQLRVWTDAYSSLLPVLRGVSSAELAQLVR